MAYSLDLRQKIVAAYANKQGSMSKLSQLFGVGKDTVRRFLKLYQTTGQLNPKRRTTGGNRAKITAVEAAFLEQVLKQEPDLTLEVLCQRLQSHFGLSISRSALDRGLKRYRLTLKKKRSMTPSAKPRIGLKKSVPT